MEDNSEVILIFTVIFFVFFEIRVSEKLPLVENKIDKNRGQDK